MMMTTVSFSIIQNLLSISWYPSPLVERHCFDRENLDTETFQLFVCNDGVAINQQIRGRIQLSGMRFLFP